MLYFYSFINNRRYERITAAEFWGVVAVANGIWIVFPMIGFYGSVRLIMEDSFSVWQ